MLNVISLGCNCNVSFLLKKMYFRCKSYPFDWLITENLYDIFNLINNNFDTFLDYDNLIQMKKLCWFHDIRNNIYFYHDFSNFKKFDVQYSYVVQKYKRRIARFYKDIENTTIFIRIVHSENDAEWISTNYEIINSSLKKYNTNNSIIFISKYKLNIKNEYCFVQSYDNIEKNQRVLSFLKEIVQNNEFFDKNQILNNKKNSKPIRDYVQRIIHKIHFSFFSKIGYRKK